MGALIFIASLFDGHDVGLVSPLTDEASPRLEGGGGRDLRPGIFVQCAGHLAESLTSTRTESTEGLFLNSVGQDPDHQVSAQFVWRWGLE
jgi:hypothetical protein